MNHSGFVHLHVHTQYSLLDGTIRLRDLLGKVKEYRMPAVAMTDHGNMFGAVDFYKQAQEYGIKPIIGCELYVAPGSRFDRSASGAGETSHHLLVLVKNLQGYKNLMKLSTAGYLEGFYYRPRVDKEILRQYHDGLIGMSACMHGEIPNLALKGKMEAAQTVAGEYREIFGDGNFYLEIMENGLPEQKTANNGILEIGRRLSLPLVATNDCHYLKMEDAEAHEVLLCIQTGKTLESPDRMRFATDQFYLRSAEEMKTLFGYCPEAIENTLAIAERCNFTLEMGSIFLPRFEVGTQETLDERLGRTAREGLDAIFSRLFAGADEETLNKYRNRLDQELEMIRAMGFAGYFLIVSDFVNYAKQKSIPVGPGRGSVAGSLVAYALGITDIDPIRYGLFFERFLNPDRKSMPDIDIDFCQEGRDEVIRYVTEKYGSEKVSQIITFGKMQAKGVIRDVGRALNIPYGEVDAIAKLVPSILNISLQTAMELEPRLKEKGENNKKIEKLLHLSQVLEGLNRHASTHAAGVVISDVPLVERIPLCKSPKDDVVTQYSMNDLQAVGLTKFDFLGLKTLTVIKNALDFIREGGSSSVAAPEAKMDRGPEIDINALPLDDKKTYQLLMRGETDGVFQLESSGMKDLLVRMKPDCIEDLIALIALYRPGPMNMLPEFLSRKQGKTKIVYEVPEVEDVLKETYGVILYQEQVMQIAGLIGGYTMAEADILRKVMSKKKASEMEKEKPKFLEGALKRNIPEHRAKKIWEQMETFAEYGFNKSHSAAYAAISYQTAFLKAHYPVEFMAALLTGEKDNRDKIIKHISSCKDMGIGVLPPDINESHRDFSVAGENIRFGLAAVKNVGASAIDSIISVRKNKGNFTSFHDFSDRIDLRKVNKRVIESLIKCGAFDSLKYNRRQLFVSYEDVMESVQKRQKGRRSGQVSLFDVPGGQEAAGNDPTTGAAMPEVPEWEQGELLAYEKDTLGFYITGHPLAKFADSLALIATADSSNIAEKKDKEVIAFGGIVSNIREVTTRKKDVMAYVTIEDLKGSVTVIFFADIYKSAYDLLHREEPVLIKGTLDIGEEDSFKVIASEISSLTEAAKQVFNSVHFMVDVGKVSPDDIESMRELVKRHQGKCDSFIHLLNGKSETVVYLGDDCRLEISEQMKRDADRILGAGATRLA